MVTKKETSNGYVNMQHAYAFYAGCQRAAEDIFNKFCNDLKDEPEAARFLRENIAEELKQAYLQGVRSHKSIDTVDPQ